MFWRTVGWLPVTAAVVFGLGPPAQAAIVQGMGANVIFEYDDADPALALYGQPTVVNDQLTFTPANFRAEALGASQTVGANATFVFDVWAKPGFILDMATLAESGDYKLENADSSVSADGFIQVKDLDTAVAVQELFTVPNLTTVGTLTTWSGQASVDIGAGFADPVQHARITMQNNLLAHTGPTGIRAFIEKKDVNGSFGVLVDTAAIPEPTSMALVGTTLLGIVGWIRRRAA